MNRLLLRHLNANNLPAFKNALGTSDINAQDKKGNTLIHLAVKNGQLSFIKTLIKTEADLGIQNQNGDLALHLAVKKGYFHVIDLLLEVFEDNDLLQKKSLKFFKMKNNQGQTPLSLAATLEDEHIYKKLLSLRPGYDKKTLDEILKIRIKKFTNQGLTLFFAALIESFCPSSSLADLIESFAYSGLTVGLSAATEFGLSVAFAVVAFVGLGLITFANYKRMAAAERVKQELEETQIAYAYFLNMKQRIGALRAASYLTAEAQVELKAIQVALLQPKYPVKRNGQATGPLDFSTQSDKIYTFLSTLGSFLCSYSGILGVIGIVFGLAAGVQGLTLSALIASAGPVGIAIALTVGLVIAAGLAFYHYRRQNEQRAAIGMLKIDVIDKQVAINKLQKQLRKTYLNTVQELLPIEDSTYDSDNAHQFQLLQCLSKKPILAHTMNADDCPIQEIAMQFR